MDEVKNNRWLPILIIVGLVIIISGFAFWQKANTPKENIKIGAILPFTGSAGFYGEYYRQTLDLASDEINNTGGINGKKIEIVYEDNQGDTDKTVTAYQKLSIDKSIQIYLTTLSGATLAIAPLAEKDHHILFNLNSAAPAISQAGDFVFRNNIYPKLEVEKMITFLSDRGYKKISILMFNNDAGAGYLDLLKSSLGNNLSIADEELYNKGATDFKTELTKIKHSNSDAVLVFAYANELGLIINQSKTLLVNQPMFSFYTAEDQKVLEIASKNADGVIYTHTFDERSSLVSGLKNKLQVRHEKVSGGLFYSATAYDTFNILVNSLKQCANEKAECVRDALYKTKDYSGVAGDTSINKDGDTEKSIIIKTIKNGQFVPYGE